MITEKDLHLEYRRDTGNEADPYTVSGYYKWIEEKYLERLNQQPEMTSEEKEKMLEDFSEAFKTITQEDE